MYYAACKLDALMNPITGGGKKTTLLPPPTGDSPFISLNDGRCMCVIFIKVFMWGSRTDTARGKYPVNLPPVTYKVIFVLLLTSNMWCSYTAHEAGRNGRLRHTPRVVLCVP